MALNPRNLLPAVPTAPPPAPLSGTKAERVQRVQIGVFGLCAMLLLVGLADIVITRAQETQANAVPEAEPTIAAPEAPAARDPLADAGVVPELPAEPTPTAAATQQPNARNDVPPPAPAQ